MHRAPEFVQLRRPFAVDAPADRVHNPVGGAPVVPTRYASPGSTRCAEVLNLSRFRPLALPRSVQHWTLTTLREKLIKIGAKVTAHSRYVFFQMAEVAVPRKLFAAVLGRIERLRFRLPRAAVG
jgi:hypothetical protein